MEKHDANRRDGTLWIHRLFAMVMTAGMVGLFVTSANAASLKSETVRAWETYVKLTEERIATELDAERGFLAQELLSEQDAVMCHAQVMAGEFCVVKLQTLDAAGDEIDVPSGMVHHWLGSVFIPGAELEELLSWVQNYNDHEQYFDEVEDSALLAREGNVFDILLRLKRKKVITVHYNTTHRVEYRRHDPSRVSAKSTTTRIAQLDNPGTPEEREKPVGEDNGFLWRLNSYWRYKQVDGGVIVETESLSLSRGIPFAVRPFVSPVVNSVPRESMVSTLGSIRRGVVSRPTD